MAPEGARSKQRSPSGSTPSEARAITLGLVVEQVDEYLEIPDVIGGQDGDYIIQLQRETMKSAGFLSGDYIVVRPTEELEADVIVVVAIGEEMALMPTHRDGEEVRLRPENEETEQAAIAERKVLGCVVGLIRKL